MTEPKQPDIVAPCATITILGNPPCGHSLSNHKPAVSDPNRLFCELCKCEEYTASAKLLPLDIAAIRERLGKMIHRQWTDTDIRTLLSRVEELELTRQREITYLHRLLGMSPISSHTHNARAEKAEAELAALKRQLEAKK